jgi:hypothetical protein
VRILLLLLLYVLLGPIVLLGVLVYVILWIVFTPFRIGTDILEFLKGVVLLPVRLVERLV